MPWQLEGRKPPSRFVIMEMLAERYGWTFEYIKSMPYSEMVALMKIIEVKNKLEKSRVKK